MKFKCKICDHEFESNIHNPMCPQGCKLDRSEVTRPGDFSTTVRLRTDDIVKAEAKAGPEPEERPLTKMNLAALREVAEAKGIEMDANETKAKLRAKIIAADVEPTPPAEPPADGTYVSPLAVPLDPKETEVFQMEEEKG